MPTVSRKRPTKTTAKTAPKGRAAAKGRSTAKATTKPATTKRSTTPKSRQPNPVKTARGIAKSQKAKTAKASTNGNGGYTRHEYLPMNVRAIVKALKADESFIETAAQYGAPNKVRRALFEAGYDTKGQKFTIDPIKGAGRVLAGRIAKRREANDSWLALSIATGRTETQLKELLSEHGFGDLAYGRVLRDGTVKGNVNGRGTGDGLPKTTRTRNKAATVNAKTARKKTGTSKAKSTVEPARTRRGKSAPAASKRTTKRAATEQPKTTVKRPPRRVARSRKTVADPS